MFSGAGDIWHWLIVLVIVIAIFGTKKLRNAGSDLGAAVRNFKDSMKDGEAKAEAEAEARRQADALSQPSTAQPGTQGPSPEGAETTAAGAASQSGTASDAGRVPRS